DPDLPRSVRLRHASDHRVQLEMFLDVEPVPAIVDVAIISLVLIQPPSKHISRIVFPILVATVLRTSRQLRLGSALGAARAHVRRPAGRVDEIDPPPGGLAIVRAPELGVCRELTQSRILALEIVAQENLVDRTVEAVVAHGWNLPLLVVERAARRGAI